MVRLSRPGAGCTRRLEGFLIAASHACAWRHDHPAPARPRRVVRFACHEVWEFGMSAGQHVWGPERQLAPSMKARKWGPQQSAGSRGMLVQAV